MDDVTKYSKTILSIAPSLLRVVSAILSFTIIHYWAFVISLQGNLSKLVDGRFFWQFQQFLGSGPIN